ncbi:MAG: hypothetical protein AMS15_07070 [Planctomycetes bacterium DG_23]|nr:MAG: hypothetical protein AMS15_07070 [Planctomycetes bacterium DG_23]
MELGLSSWSLHREIDEKTSMLEFIRLAKKEFGLCQVELCSRHFASIEREYLDEVKKTLEEFGVKVANMPMMVGNISSEDALQWEYDIAEISKWFAAARHIGSFAIRVNTRGKDTEEETVRRVIDGYRALLPAAHRTGVHLLLENHGGVSKDPDIIARIMTEIDDEFFGTCPDLGNFPDEIRYEALAKICPFMQMAHIKTYEFDEAGNETTIDVDRAFEIFRDAGYDGVVSIEYEGKGEERDGVRKSIALAKKFL